MARVLYILLGLVVWSPASLAYSQVGQYEFSVWTGPFMTGNIVAATEPIILSGARFGYNFENWRPFLTYGSGSENGKNFEVMAIGLKKPLTFIDLGGMDPFFIFGAQTSTFDPPELKGGGFNLGFGMDIELNKVLQFRTDFTYFNEGVVKYLVLSLGFQLTIGNPSGGSGAN